MPNKKLKLKHIPFGGQNNVKPEDHPRWSEAEGRILSYEEVTQGGTEAATPRAIPEIEEHLASIRDLLYGKNHVVEPAIRARLGRQRRELRDELAEAKRRLAAVSEETPQDQECADCVEESCEKYGCMKKWNAAAVSEETR